LRYHTCTPKKNSPYYTQGNKLIGWTLWHATSVLSLWTDDSHYLVCLWTTAPGVDVDGTLDSLAAVVEVHRVGHAVVAPEVVAGVVDEAERFVGHVGVAPEVVGCVGHAGVAPEIVVQVVGEAEGFVEHAGFAPDIVGCVEDAGVAPEVAVEEVGEAEGLVGHVGVAPEVAGCAGHAVVAPEVVVEVFDEAEEFVGDAGAAPEVVAGVIDEAEVFGNKVARHSYFATVADFGGEAAASPTEVDEFDCPAGLVHFGPGVLLWHTPLQSILVAVGMVV